MSAAAPPGTARLVIGLAEVGITHVLGIPDNTSAPLFDALNAGESGIRLVTVTREGEAFSIAAGLWLGGASPFVVIQGTGLLESGDALRGTAVRMGVPLPFLVTGRGYATLRSAGLQTSEPLTRDLLLRPDVDSVALLTERTLDAWGIPYEVCGAEMEPLAVIERTVQTARAEERPVALLLARPIT